MVTSRFENRQIETALSVLSVARRAVLVFGLTVPVAALVIQRFM